MTLSDGTLLVNNDARLGGKALFVEGADTVMYVLPAPLGRWILAAAGSTQAAIPQGATNEYPYPCPPGFFGDTHDAAAQTGSQCSGLCVAGTYCPAGTITPIVCTQGSYCALGSPFSVPCLAGSYGASTGLKAATECSQCRAGSACTIGSTQPTACNPGSYSGAGSGACVPCEKGTYQDATGASQCKDCTAGHYCPEGATVPLSAACEPGTFLNPDVNTFSGQGDCLDCTVGHFCFGGAVGQIECGSGTYASVERLTECRECDEGSFQKERGATACEVCGAGHYCGRGAVAETPCPGGTFSNRTGRSRPDQCEDVPVHFWAPLGSALPEACPPSGFYCPGRRADTVMDPPGSKPIMQEMGGSTETEEVPVVTTTLALEMSIDEFAAQREAMIEALAAQYGVDPSLITLDAAAGSVAITVTIAVPPAPPGADGAQASSSLSVDDLLDKVNAVDDSTLGASLATALNMANISVSTTAAPSRATVERTVNVVCPVGHWCTAGRIVPCPMSTYNNRTKQNEATSCLRCPVFSETRDEASTSLDDCVCEKSYYDATVGHGVECLGCPRGSACQGNATLDRLPIEPGKWRTGPDSVVIETCAVEKSCVGGEDPAAYCLEGHKGPLCMVCESGYRLSSVNGCVVCEGGSLGPEEIVSAAVFGGLLLVCVCACCRQRRGGRLTRMTGAKERRYREPSKDSTQRIIDKLLTKFKIMTAHQQVLQALSNVYRVDWPPAFKRLLSYLQVFNFDFSSSCRSTACSRPTTCRSSSCARWCRW